MAGKPLLTETDCSIASLSSFSGNGVSENGTTNPDPLGSRPELKANPNPMKVVSSGNGMPIAVLNRNEPAFYCVPAAAYEAMMELLDDIELLKLVKGRIDEPAVSVSLDDL